MRYPLITTGFTAVLALAGCRIESSLVPGKTIRPAQAAEQPREQVPAERGGDYAGGGNTPSNGYSYSPSCQTPQNHCLLDDDVIVANKAFSTGWTYARAGVQQGAASADGEASFLMRNNGETKVTRDWYQTRPASPDELAIGMPVAMFHDNKDDGIYRGPETREDAHGKRWWLARIISIDPLQNGYVLVSNGYKVGVEAVRVIVGDDSPTTRVAGAEDEHFLHENHYIVTSGRLKDSGWSYMRVGAPIREPSDETNGEGHFIQLNDGDVYWTENGFRTRKATESDLSVGTRVFMFHDNRDNSVYQPPRNRSEALAKRWWTARITDTSELYKGAVQVAGRYTVSLDAIRVAY